MADIQYAPDAWSLNKTGYTPKFNSPTGHGAKIPTSWMLYDGKYNRVVYAICFSNVSSHYVLVRGGALVYPRL